MDRQVIDQKLESLRRCLSRIESKMPFDAVQLAGDFDLQDFKNFAVAVTHWQAD